MPKNPPKNGGDTVYNINNVNNIPERQPVQSGSDDVMREVPSKDIPKPQVRRQQPGNSRYTYNAPTSPASQRKVRDYQNFAHRIVGQNDAIELKALQALDRHMDNYNRLVQRYSGDNAPPLSEKAYQNLQTTLANAFRTTRWYCDRQPKKTAFYSSMQKIGEVLGKEYRVYRDHPWQPGATLSDMIRDTREKAIIINDDVDANSIDRVGNFSNTRMLLNLRDPDTQKVTKGVFTEKICLDYKEAMQNRMAKWPNRYDEQLRLMREGVRDAKIDKVRNKKQKNLEETEKHIAQYREFLNTVKDCAGRAGLPAEKYYLEMFGYEGKRFVANEDAPRKLRELSRTNTNPYLRQFLDDELSACRKRYLSQMHNFDERHHLQIGDRIDNRNSAMSAVADLLGKDHLLARSDPMSLKKPDGTVVKGTFMNFAEGTDLQNIHPDDPCLKSKADPFSNTPGLKSVADLHIIDYICGNSDRHSKNMLYQFDDNGNFKGVIGIDNDMSFGTLQEDDIGYGSNADDLQFISRDMAQKIATTSPAALRLALGGYGLKEADIAGAEQRLTTLQNMLARQKGYPSIKVVGDNEWKDLSVSDLCKNSKNDVNIFNMLTAANQSINRARQYYEQIEINDERLEEVNKKISDLMGGRYQNEMPDEDIIALDKLQLEHDDVRRQNKAELESLGRAPYAPRNYLFTDADKGWAALEKKEDYRALANKMKAFADDLHAKNKGLFVGSKEYDNMMYYTEYMQKELQKMSEQPSPDLKTEDGRLQQRANFGKTQDMLEILRDVTGMYLQHRGEDGKLATSSTAQNRTFAATELYSFAKNNCDKFNVTADELYRAGMDNERAAAYKQMSAKEIARSIKNLTAAQSGKSKNMSADARHGELKQYLRKRKTAAKTEREKEPQLIH